MSLLVLGINHRSAPVALREQVSFAPEQLESALQRGCSELGAPELVIASTCNRTEVSVASEALTAEQLRAWLASYHGLDEDCLQRSTYAHRGDAALRHLMRVASGLDSMVLGEPQILGQMRSAYASAQQAGTIGAQLGRIFPWVLSTARQVRTDTAIGENPVSVAFAAVSMVPHIFANPGRARALLVGAGETIELVARHLQERGVRQIVVANRTLERARELAEQFDAEAVVLGDIPERLVAADIVITSTASPLPILGKGTVEQAMKRRKHSPVLMVDIAVPRDIEPQVGRLDNVYLYSVDDLQEMVEENLRARREEAERAEVIIDQRVAEFRSRLRSQDAVAVVRALREQAEQMRDAEVDKALRQLARGMAPEQVVARLARGLTNKLMHAPSAQTRKAGARGQQEQVDWVRELFGLNEDPRK